MASFFEPKFRLDVANRAGFDFRLQHFRCGPGVSVSRVAFNADVMVEIERVNAYMVQMPLAGRNDLRLGGESGTRHVLSNRLFAVIGPERSLRQQRSPDCEMVLVRFSAPHLAECLAAHIGDGAGMADFLDVEFAVEMPGQGLASAPWSRLPSSLLGGPDKAAASSIRRSLRRRRGSSLCRRSCFSSLTATRRCCVAQPTTARRTLS